LRLATALLVVGACAGAPRPARRGIEGAALPYQVLRARGGAQVADADFRAALRAARAVCLGEAHGSPHDHWLQLHLFDAQSAGAPPGTVALGLEMFQRPFQGVLDDYAAGRIDDDALLGRTGWHHRWGYPWKLYRPIVALAQRRGAPLLALNARHELVDKVAKKGLAALDAGERAELPELRLDDERHRAFFRAATRDHDTPGTSEESFYAAQVVWDETMAETGAVWLRRDPRRRLAILAGAGHCHETAVPARLRRRGIGPVLSVRALIDDAHGNVAAALAQPEGDFLVVMRSRR